MKCPIDGADLVMTERQGVEIDYCPKCRGVWLDRGELDKIIERSASEGNRPAGIREQQYAQPPRPEQYVRHERGYGEHRHHGEYKKHKPKSFLSEIFDFD